jgi:hypothetical protein
MSRSLVSGRDISDAPSGNQHFKGTSDRSVILLFRKTLQF